MLLLPIRAPFHSRGSTIILASVVNARLPESEMLSEQDAAIANICPIMLE